MYELTLPPNRKKSRDGLNAVREPGNGSNPMVPVLVLINGRTSKFPRLESAAIRCPSSVPDADGVEGNFMIFHGPDMPVPTMLEPSPEEFSRLESSTSDLMERPVAIRPEKSVPGF